MGSDDLTIEILKQIRDEVKQTNVRLDAANQRLDRVVQEQIRHATAIVALEKGQRALEARMDAGFSEVAQEIRKLGDRIDNMLTGEMGTTLRSTVARVDALEARLAKLERQAG